MRVRDLMTADVITIGPDASLKEAARRMIEAGVSGLVVTDDGHLVGVITEADFVKGESDRRTKKRARVLSWFSHDVEVPHFERLVGDVMTTDVVSVSPETDHAEVARVMQAKRIKRLPVVDDGGLVGIISRSDILRAFARPDESIIEELRDHVMRKVLWVDPKRVQIHVVEGNVVLEGQLETKSDAVLLEDLAGRLDGVVSVKSRLTWEVDNTKLEMVSPPPGVPPHGNWA
jgi:CBS domain-containing protein